MTEEELANAEKIAKHWSEQGASPEVQLKWVMSSFYFVFKNHLYICRRAKNKLPKEIQKKIEEWKFSSGVLIMCLVAYSDKSPSLSSLSTSLFLLASLDIYFPVWRVLLLLGIPLPTLIGTGRKGCTKFLKNGLLKIQPSKYEFQWWGRSSCPNPEG